MALAVPPKPVPKSLRLNDAAAHIVELESSLDINEVRQALCDAVADGRLTAQSEFQQPGDESTWRGYRARRAGLMGRTFAETWRLWLENEAPINWAAGTIFLSGGSIPLPLVEWDDVLRLFQVATQEASAPQQRTREEIEQEVTRWYRDEFVRGWSAATSRGDKPPTEPETMTAAKQKFLGVPKLRDFVRAARAKVAPEEWRKPGPYRSRRELADHLAQVDEDEAKAKAKAATDAADDST